MSMRDRRSYDLAASGEVQGELATIISRLEALIGERDAQVANAMSDFMADGVSDQYHAIEMQWHGAASEVRAIIDLVKTTMVNNDTAATTAMAGAQRAVDSIM